jgi:hypothetical protein
MLEKYYFDLDYEMIKTLGEEFDPKRWIKELVDGKESPDVFFTRYGKELMERSLELGEKNTDRTYEVLKDAVEKTGSMKFPLLPQRFVEIAYLSIQPFKRLWVCANSPKIFSYKIKECSVYEELQRLGEEVVRELPCKNACISLLKGAFSAFDLNTEISMESNLVEGDECLFTVKNREKS